MAEINEEWALGKKYRVMADPETNKWEVYSFASKAVDVLFDDNKDAQTKLGDINGITDSLASTDSGIALSAKAGNELNKAISELQKPTSQHWDVQFTAEDWQDAADNNTFAGITAAYKASKFCEGMTAATDISGIQFTSGDRTAAGKWDFLRPTEGSVELYATAKPAATFSLRLTEVK